MRPSCFLLPLLALLAAPLPADEPTVAAAEPILGKRYDQLALLDFPDQHYALYLPEGARERPFPLLVVLDPRGRALDALERFLPTASRLGWIVASSYESRSDEGSERNAQTLPALLTDLQKRVVVNDRRVYFAGFSGTARAAYTLAVALGEHAGGVIANCGGLPPGEEATKHDFAYFGATGTLDFNYAEMSRLESAFARLGMARRFEVFAGEHSWGPPEMMRRALLWLELQAMKKKLRPQDPALIAELLALDLARAEALPEALARFEAYEQIERDFTGWAELGDLPARRAALAQDTALLAARKEREKLLDLEAGYPLKIAEWQRAFVETELPLPLNKSLAMLLVPSLQAAAAGESPAALSAQRRLRQAFSEASHYLPTRLENESRLRHLAASLELATAIRPEVAWAHIELARAELRIGREKEARRAFARGLELGYAKMDVIAGDEYLAKLQKLVAAQP